MWRERLRLAIHLLGVHFLTQNILLNKEARAAHLGPPRLHLHEEVQLL